MNIAVLTIATGDYFGLYRKLKHSLDKFFLLDHDIHIFLLTDAKYKPYNTNETVISIQHFPWPINTLFRFEYFIKLDLSEFDFVYYIDSDCLLVDEVDYTIFPDYNFSAVIHPLKSDEENHFETNPESTACVSDSTCTMDYYQACFYGGTTIEMVTMFDLLRKNIASDLKKNIIAKWHDESHLNWYFRQIDPRPKNLGDSYAFPNPEKWTNYDSSELPKIIHLNQASATS